MSSLERELATPAWRSFVVGLCSSPARRLSRRGGAVTCAALVLLACGSSSSSIGSARIGVALTAAVNNVARITATISAGEGSAFTPIVSDLQSEGTSWSAVVTGIPAGPGRRFDLVAVDATGQTVFSGTGVSDITPGAVAKVVIVLQGTPTDVVTTVPIVVFVSASASPVAPGSDVTVRASARDANGRTLSYLWSPTCGSFATISDPTVIWTAPNQGPATCTLSIQVSDDQGSSTTASIAIDVTAGRSVTGTRLVTWWPGSSAANVTAPAPDVATLPAPSAWVRGANGAWQQLPGGSRQPDGTVAPGHFGTDGSFVIPGVPLGPYVLCQPLGSAQACSDASADVIDLGYDLLGRPGQTPATLSTAVTFALTGLEPWNPFIDEVQLSSIGANLWEVVGAVGAFRGGDTGGTLIDDWHAPNGGGPPLVLSTAADDLQIHQLATQSIYANGALVPYATAARATPASPDPIALAGLALTDGRGATVAAALKPLALTSSLALDWDLPAFEAHRAAMGPAARTSAGASAHRFRVGASAFQLTYPAPAAAGAPELLKMLLPAGFGRTAGTLWHGEFLGPPWRAWLEASFTVQVQYLAHGASAPLLESAAVVQRDAAPRPAGPIEPVLSPPLSPRIGSADALQDATGVGLTPAIAWSPPAVGVPTAYSVEVYALSATGAATTSVLVLRYRTTATSVTLPPGVLAAGGLYYARITAEVSGVPYALAPFRQANAFARASVLTGTFSP